MARTITADEVSRVVRENLGRLAWDLPADVQQALQEARAAETGLRGRRALDLLLANARTARDERMPLCQDTGTVWCCLEAGPDVAVAGDALAGVDEAVAAVYTGERLRKSLVADALSDRSNTGDNTPAFTELRLVERPGARLHLMLKGGGSDNASRVAMLPPSAGRQGVIDTVLACVSEKAANACPPLIVGVGVGATFDKVASLAKHALMRPVGSPAADPAAAALEGELLDAVNATGIGPAALGGRATALAVHLETAPCHIAALPVAVNMGCSALRRGTYEL